MIIRDTELTTISEMTDRINSISRQVDKLDNVMRPRDWTSYNNKCIKLNKRKDLLWDRRAKLLQAEKKNIKEA